MKAAANGLRFRRPMTHSQTLRGSFTTESHLGKAPLNQGVPIRFVQSQPSSLPQFCSASPFTILSAKNPQPRMQPGTKDMSATNTSGKVRLFTTGKYTITLVFAH